MRFTDENTASQLQTLELSIAQTAVKRFSMMEMMETSSNHRRILMIPSRSQQPQLTQGYMLGVPSLPRSRRGGQQQVSCQKEVEWR